MVQLRTTEEMRNTIRDNNVKLYLRIAYYNLSNINTTETNDTEYIPEAGIVFDGIIRIYEKPFESTASKKEDDEEGTPSQAQSAPFIFYTVSGIPEALIEKNETTINEVFEDAELSDAIVYELSNIDKESEIYIQETVNKEKYQDILIPPVSLTQAIKFLDNTYHHIYKHGCAFFIDSGKIYLYDPLSDNMPETNILEINVLPTSATENLKSSTVMNIDENNNLKISYRTMPAYTIDDEIATHSLGSHTIYYYYDENFNLITRDKTNNSAFTKNRYLWEKMSDYSSEMADKGSGMGLAFSNLNPDYINPLTKIKLVSTEYKQCEGEFFISEMAFMFSTKDNKHFQNTISISTIKK